jgi:hypothetical protein
MTLALAGELVPYAPPVFLAPFLLADGRKAPAMLSFPAVLHRGVWSC